MSKLFCLLLVSLLSSCATTTKLEIVNETKEGIEFKAVYSSFHFIGGITSSAEAASEWLADELRSTAQAKGKHCQGGELVASSADRNIWTGINTIKFKGWTKLGAEPELNAVLVDLSAFRDKVQYAEMTAALRESTIAGATAGAAANASATLNQISANMAAQTQMSQMQFNQQMQNAQMQSQLRQMQWEATRTRTLTLMPTPGGGAMGILR